jgi:hypothetical protein
VKLNGVGPSNSPKFSWALQKVFNLSCKLYHKTGENHDFKYHMLDYGKEKADEEFLNEMEEARDKGAKWYNRGWYAITANSFYKAVDLGGQGSYDEAQFECLCAVNLASRRVR